MRLKSGDHLRTRWYQRGLREREPAPTPYQYLAVVVRVEYAYVYVRWIRPHEPDGDRLSAYTHRVLADLFRRVYS